MFRSPKHLGRWLAIAVAIGLVGCAVALAAKPPNPVTPAYRIVPFVSPFSPEGCNSVESQVMDLNDCGQAVGFEKFSDGTSPPVYQALHLNIAAGTYTLLADGCLPSGVNDLNQIVGERRLADGRRVGMFLSAPGVAGAVDLPPLARLGHTQSAATAINGDGVVVGYSWNDDETSASAAVWIVRVLGDAVSVHGPWDLPPLAGDARACAEDLNELDGGLCQVTGISFGATDDSYEAVVWTVAVAGTTATPGAAVSLVVNHAWSVGSGINDSGDVCGLVDVDNKAMPFLASAGETAQPLPVPRGTYYGHARDVNNLGEVVGSLDILSKGGWSDASYAYLWKDGEMVNLAKLIDPDSGWGRLRGASVISDAGTIGGYGLFDIGTRGFLLIRNP